MKKIQRDCEVCGMPATIAIEWKDCDTGEMLDKKPLFLCKSCSDVEIELCAIAVEKHRKGKRHE